MASRVREWSGVVVLLVATFVSSAAAQNEELRVAETLFEQQNYVAAQAALLDVDRDALTEAEQARLDELLKIVPEAIKASERAVHDVAAGDRAYEAGEWDEAYALYDAVRTNPFARVALREYADAQLNRIQEKKGLAEAARPMGTVEERAREAEEPAETVPEAEIEPPVVPETPRRLTPTDELRIRDALLWQQAAAKADALADAVRAAMAADDYAEARKLLDMAVQAVEAARRYAEPVSKYEVARERLVALRDEVALAAETYQTRKAAEQRDAIAQRVKERRELYEQQRLEKVEQLFNSADQLRRERRFGEAAEVLREILRIEPGNAKARFQLEVAEDYESFARQAQWQRDVYSQQRSALVTAEEALIPWDVDVLYPKNWRELIARRNEISATGSGANLEDAELNKKLDAVQPEVRFEQQPFEQVVDFLADLQKINISVDWTDLEDRGVERDTPVTIRLSGLSFRTILDEVLGQVSRDVQIAYAVGDGLLRVASKEKLDKDKLILIYDIRDLLVRVPRATRQAAFDVTQGMGEQGGGGGGGGGGQGMFGEAGGRDQDQNFDEEGQDNQVLVDEILDIIRQTVEPDSWRETGAGDASIRELNGQLIIYNTADAHRQVQDLLGQLRETRAMQISVETRFLDVVANFLEEFGVDLDFVFNSGAAGFDRVFDAQGQPLTDPGTGASVLTPRQFSRIGTFASPPAFGTPFTPGAVPQQPYSQAAFVPTGTGVIPQSGYMTPITAQQGSISLVDLRGRPTGVPGSFAEEAALTPALNIAGSFLDNLQVDFLIRATQANARSSVVQAPRLVLFNGQASSISVGRSRSYVASLEPRLAEGAVGFAPEVQSADSGVFMWVEGTISADRRYVTLTLDVRQRGEPTFERFEVQRASGSSPGAFIMLPDYAFVQLSTTVSIPDGGTVLLGGVKQVGEVEIEAGVPILSKIPVLKRAFTNQSMVKDTRTLLILVKTKIILQKEAEDEAFPTFSSAGG